MEHFVLEMMSKSKCCERLVRIKWTQGILSKSCRQILAYDDTVNESEMNLENLKTSHNAPKCVETLCLCLYYRTHLFYFYKYFCFM